MDKEILDSPESLIFNDLFSSDHYESNKDENLFTKFESDGFSMNDLDYSVFRNIYLKFLSI
jgi:hypothetical protein